MDGLLPFLALTLALIASPGPNTLSLAAVGASFGPVRSLGYYAGLNLGMVAVIAAVGSGLAGAILAVPGIAPVVTAVAVVYFLHLAWRIATAPPLRAPKAHDLVQVPRWYEGSVVSLANPKAYAAMAALFSSRPLVEGTVLVDYLAKGATIIVSLLVVNVGWLAIGAGLTRWLRSDRAARVVNVAFAVVLVLSVGLAALL